MSDFQLTHIALVGARISAFHPLGYRTRDQLTMCRVAPPADRNLFQDHGEAALRRLLKIQLPVWIHNIIVDGDFPQRGQLQMPLRRFEGELKDKKNDEVISAVLSSGFRNEELNPLDLPAGLSTRERCAIVAHLQTWQAAYLALEEDILDVLCAMPSALDRWCELARQPEYALID